jgi:hypothetical protein
MGGYVTPAGFGDTFYVYAFDADSLTNGQDAYNQRVVIADGQFVMRQWAGLYSCASGIQIRNRLQNPLNSGSKGATMSGFKTGTPVIPEVWYPGSGYIGFDLFNVNRTVIGTDGGNTIYGAQLAFAGVRRRAGVASDPMESRYKYYEKPYSYRFDLSINQYASVSGVSTSPQLNQLYVDDQYDFVLQRIRVVKTPTPGTEYTTPTFKILLYNGNKEAVSNIPLLSTNLVNFPITSTSGTNIPTNYFPTPGIMYRANSVIQFYITSLLLPPTLLPVAYDLEFSGVRRYPC